MAAKKTSDTKPLTIADIRAKIEARKSQWMPCAEALEQLDELKAMKDAGEPVNAQDAMELLRSYGWSCSMTKFDKLMMERYGRMWSHK